MCNNGNQDGELKEVEIDLTKESDGDSASLKDDITQDTDKNPRYYYSHSYTNRKSIAQGMLDVGLLVANSSQLRATIDFGNAYKLYYPQIVLIVLSILLQLCTGIIIVKLASIKVDCHAIWCRANRLNNVVMILTIVIVALNALISSFGFNHSS